MEPSQNAVHLLVPNASNERSLHAGRVVQTNGEEIVIEFERAVAPPAGTDVSIFFDVNGKFMQQGARIVAVNEIPLPSPLDDADELPAEDYLPVQMATILRIGAPLSAEGRGSYRVSILSLEVFARIESERRCQIIDVSCEGMAVICKKNHRLGSLLRIMFDCGGEEQDGRVRVQTVKDLGGGKFRIGLLVPSVEKKMRLALQRMTSWAQRLQLQRIRKSA